MVFWPKALPFNYTLIGLPENSQAAKKTVFPYEFRWLVTAQSGFIHALEHIWNSWASARKDIILLVCGTAAAWIINTPINNTGDLHNRVTLRMHRSPGSGDQYL